MLDVASIVIPLAIFGGGMYWLYRAGERGRLERGIPDRVAKRILWFNFAMAAVLLVVATVVGTGIWVLVWVIVVLLGTAVLRFVLK